VVKLMQRWRERARSSPSGSAARSARASRRMPSGCTPSWRPSRT
jgi:hypothetical protein